MFWHCNVKQHHYSTVCHWEISYFQSNYYLIMEHTLWCQLKEQILDFIFVVVGNSNITFFIKYFYGDRGCPCQQNYCLLYNMWIFSKMGSTTSQLWKVQILWRKTYDTLKVIIYGGLNSMNFWKIRRIRCAEK